jgi:CRP-like cAMP-binding protein
MVNAFIRKLQGYCSLDPPDLALLERVCSGARVVSAHTDLIREGDKPGPVFIVLEGWACRYKLLPEGGRQITAFLLPGDTCDLHVSILQHMDHSIATLTKANVAVIPSLLLEQLTETHPGITRALWWTQLVDEAVLRAWIVSLGRRDAVQRVAHLLSELWQRALAVGLVVDDILRLPITQMDIADALGLTNIHVNRVLQDLRHDQLVRLDKGRAFSVLDPTALALRAGFQPDYLHRFKPRRNEELAPCRPATGRLGRSGADISR